MYLYINICNKDKKLHNTCKMEERIRLAKRTG